MFREEQDVQVLVAYLVSSRNWSVIELREELSQKLPAYMIPSYFAQIESLPLTANGKVDKYSLESNPYLTSKQDYVSPSNQSEVLISRVVEEVLGIEKLGMYDNFFELGASSLEIMKIAAKLSLHFELSVNDIYKYPTVNCLAKKIRYTTNHLRQQIEEAKKQFVTKAEQWKLPLVMDERINSYEEHCQKYRKIDLHEAHHYQNILLCGVTGFLGIHLLRELLINTKAIVYLFVRGNTVEEARQRLRDKLRFYHMEEIYFQNINRVKLFNGDISKESFGLTEFDYKFLCEKIDAILNSAANVKHYGVFDSFNRPNVIGTKNLIEFAETDKSKHLHLISTISVASGSIEDVNQCLFTEYDCDVNQQTDSYYIQTKMEAEKLVIEARSRGIITNIYRVGNLVFQSDTGIFQENISENSFYTLIKSLVSLGIIPAIELENLDFTFINEVSGAIIKLMDIKSLVNETHHLVNPYRISLKELFGYIQEIEGQTQCTSPVQFLDFLLECLENNKYGTEIENLLFHSNLLERPDQTIFVVKNGKTDLLLRRLGHLWSKVTVSHIDKMLKHCKEVNFIG
ncbi:MULTISPECIES: SDR family oxidoreductase [unclassified Bacillus cereus group]|uniref:SDR family oxidoreductase n=1 Tax=unclassified Bacillus cereus group TaxID=2750818 RepID=UPI0024CC37B0|nr:MAG: SDR family oxidoreductase [Bacillus paranthracis]WAI34881.1 MAG: SDR family oxidoreductase [Bacillus paranthracis]WAI36999.1 MAG: SDR family oxidoreductase [Bacillus paranthracis]